MTGWWRVITKVKFIKWLMVWKWDQTLLDYYYYFFSRRWIWNNTKVMVDMILMSTPPLSFCLEDNLWKICCRQNILLTLALVKNNEKLLILLSGNKCIFDCIIVSCSCWCCSSSLLCSVTAMYCFTFILIILKHLCSVYLYFFKKIQKKYTYLHFKQ